LRRFRERNGILEWWNNGILEKLEQWTTGRMECWKKVGIWNGSIMEV
jgi:hypothetical protein